MFIVTYIGLRDYLRTGTVWHGDFDSQLGIGHGTRLDMFGHPIPPGAAAGIAQLDVTGDSAEELSGVILFLS